MQNRHIGLLIATVISVFTANSQTLSDALPTGKALGLPTTVTGMTVVDGYIYCSTKSLALHVKENSGMLSSVVPHQVTNEDKSTVNYAIRNPQSGELFYTKKSLFGASRLYHFIKEANGSSKSVQIKPGGRNIAVEHPTFSEDGSFIVFSAKSGDSHGGKDLYVTVKTEQGWSMPKNLDSINTTGDETCPYIWNGYLFFATNGRNGSFGGSDIYALRLNAEIKAEDNPHSETTVTYGKLQHLPYPFNSERDERAILVNDGLTYVVQAGDSNSMGDILNSYDCTPDMIALSGTVRDKKGHPQPRAQVTLISRDRKRLTTTTDGEGHYQLLLRKDRMYFITYGKVTYCNEDFFLTTSREGDETLIEERFHDVALVSFDPGQYIELQTLFGDDASIELTAEGRSKLISIIGFLKGNPGVEVQMTMYCGLTKDDEFNKILADKRAQAIREYVTGQVPNAEKLNVSSGGNLDLKKNTTSVNDLLTIKLGLF